MPACLPCDDELHLAWFPLQRGFIIESRESCQKRVEVVLQDTVQEKRLVVSFSFRILHFGKREHVLEDFRVYLEEFSWSPKNTIFYLKHFGISDNNPESIDDSDLR